MLIDRISQAIIWIILPFVHFMIWKERGKQDSHSFYLKFKSNCNQNNKLRENSPHQNTIHSSVINENINCKSQSSSKSCASLSGLQPHLELRNSHTFDSIRNERLAEITSVYMKNKNTILLSRSSNESCSRYFYHTSGTVAGKFCFGVVYYSGEVVSNHSYNLIRSDIHYDENTGILKDTLTKLKETFLGPP